jgi:hypothetical protein
MSTLQILHLDTDRLSSPLVSPGFYAGTLSTLLS